MIITLVPQKKADKPQLKSLQRNFSRLRNRVEKLQLRLKKAFEDLDSALQFYFEKVYPAEKEMRSSQTAFVKLLYSHYKNPDDLSLQERKTLKALISYEMSDIFYYTTFQQVDPEIFTIFKDVEGVDYKEAILEKLTSLREEIAESGMEIDFSDVDFGDSTDEVTRKIYEVIREIEDQMRGEEPVNRQKSPREQERERRAQELRDLQDRDLEAIYQQLAKIVHPDLERDPLLKEKKEGLMKKLTAAYESRDLYALLSLEMRFMNSESGDSKARVPSEEKLTIYNSILKEQVESLKELIDCAHLEPKYGDIMRYSQTSLSPFFLMQIALEEAQDEAKKYRSAVRGLRSWRAKKVLCSILAQVADEQSTVSSI